MAFEGTRWPETATTRTQRQHWARDKLTEVCRDVIQEATRIQRALLHRWEGSTDPIEWVGWNQALARDTMEADRLAFINYARRGVLNARMTIRTPLNSWPDVDPPCLRPRPSEEAEPRDSATSPRPGCP
ncbi:hypothetical protein [Amycolatopsis sp. WGS_07]|uniref:hypothetical protein n=1 Tax=Amycolatopsis sp. WGS_07 TaxID=3076764 RepID=UPI003872EE95